MIPSTGSVKYWPDGRAHVEASLRLTGNSSILCCAYADRPPILSLTDAHVSVTISVPDPDSVTPGDLATARRLADAVSQYVAELSRHAPPLPAQAA